MEFLPTGLSEKENIKDKRKKKDEEKFSSKHAHAPHAHMRMSYTFSKWSLVTIAGIRRLDIIYSKIKTKMYGNT